MKIITLDIDTKDEFIVQKEILKSLLIVKKLKKIIIEPSVKKGYHITIWTTFPYKKKEIFDLRYKLGDDRHRIKMDKLRPLARETFFFKKGKLTRKEKEYLKK